VDEKGELQYNFWKFYIAIQRKRARVEAAADFVAFGGWIGLSDFRNDFDTMAASNIIILLLLFISFLFYLSFFLAQDVT